jgi:two-component system sensor histidine kinase KdpD
MRRQSWAIDARDLVLALGAIALITAGFGRLEVTNPTIVALTYLLVVLLAAARSVLWVAIVSSVGAVLLLNYFFMPPVRTFTIVDPENWVALLVLLVVSLVASNLSSSVRARAREAIARRDELSRLFDLSRDILLTTESENAHLYLARSIARRFELDYVAICLPGHGEWRLHEAGARSLVLPRSDLDAALGAAQGTLEFDARERIWRSLTSRTDGTEVGPHPAAIERSGDWLLASAAGRSSPAHRCARGVAAIAVERVQFLEERKARSSIGRAASSNRRCSRRSGTICAHRSRPSAWPPATCRPAG